MSKITISFQVLPGGLPDKTSTYAAVDAAIAVVAASGLPYTVGAMETTLEGEYEVIMAVIKQAIDAVIAAGANRVFVNVKIDYDPRGSTIDEKLEKYRPT
jgi:uncharacterized protein YqgV (UPF0045/DUF77 family)